MTKMWVERREKPRLGLDVGGYLACRDRDRDPHLGPGPRGRARLVVQNDLRGRHEPLFRRVLCRHFGRTLAPVAMHEVQPRVAMSRPVGKAEDLPAGLLPFSGQQWILRPGRIRQPDPRVCVTLDRGGSGEEGR